jgi:hypothetical protein
MEREGMEKGYAMPAMGQLRIELEQYSDNQAPISIEVSLLSGKAGLNHTDVVD